MHDPMTTAFDIHLFGYWLATIWHVDPETDGTDNSCGFGYPKLTERERGIVAQLVKQDLEFPYFSSPSHIHTSIVVDPAYEYRQQQGDNRNHHQKLY